MTREIVIEVRVRVGPLTPEHSHATGTTFSGWTPNRVGQSVATELMRELGVGERIHEYVVARERGFTAQLQADAGAP